MQVINIMLVILYTNDTNTNICMGKNQYISEHSSSYVLLNMYRYVLCYWHLLANISIFILLSCIGVPFYIYVYKVLVGKFSNTFHQLHDLIKNLTVGLDCTLLYNICFIPFCVYIFSSWDTCEKSGTLKTCWDNVSTFTIYLF